MTIMDLEELARRLYEQELGREDIITRLSKETGSDEKAEAIYKEIRFSEELATYLRNNPNSFLEKLTTTPSTTYSADESGLGCRGKGDEIIHRLIAHIIGKTDAIVDSRQGDDGGVVSVSHARNELYIALAVDGVHSRLSHYPFLAGFHVARAALRDVIAMGALPFAIFSDIHLGNDGDPAKIFDHVSGISTVAESLNVPYLCGSTLRIGGDLVIGERLTGSVGAAGLVIDPEVGKRSASRPGDILIMTRGNGGGTITTTAIFNGFYDVALETIELDFIKLGRGILQDRAILGSIHSIMDITNGGIIGDMVELSRTTNLSVTLYKEKILALINSRVLAMLEELDIDPLGISTDSMLISVPGDLAKNVMGFIAKQGFECDVVGEVSGGGDGGAEMFIEEADGTKERLVRAFREAPYTPIKKVIGTSFPVDFDVMDRALKKAAEESLEKKRIVVDHLKEK